MDNLRICFGNALLLVQILLAVSCCLPTVVSMTPSTSQEDPQVPSPDQGDLIANVDTQVVDLPVLYYHSLFAGVVASVGGRLVRSRFKLGQVIDDARIMIVSTLSHFGVTGFVVISMTFIFALRRMWKLAAVLLVATTFVSTSQIVDMVIFRVPPAKFAFAAVYVTLWNICIQFLVRRLAMFSMRPDIYLAYAAQWLLPETVPPEHLLRDLLQSTIDRADQARSMLNRLGERDDCGITQKQIDSLPTRIFSATETRNGSEQQMCRVCLCGYEEGDEIRTLDCFHSFHSGCIDTWLRQNANCPICKHPAVPDHQVPDL